MLLISEVKSEALRWDVRIGGKTTKGHEEIGHDRGARSVTGNHSLPFFFSISHQEYPASSMRPDSFDMDKNMEG